jgi:hypothetical protein
VSDSYSVSVSVSDSLTPLTPPRGGACAGDGEPFAPEGPPLPPDPPPPFANPPELVARVAATAERLFPLQDLAAQVHRCRGDYDLAVLEASLLDAAAAGKRGGNGVWRYVLGIYANRVADGRGAATAAAPGRASAPASALPPEERRRLMSEALERAKALKVS